jgi:Nuclease-related domain
MRPKRLSYARRQQYRRLSRAAMAALASGATGLLALTVAEAGAVSAAGALFVLAVGLGLHARHRLSLADRSRIGARSEDEVRRALPPLHAEGWRLRHSLNWRGCGDIDSLAIGPDGVAFVIETKTRTYHDRHLARVREQAAWLSRRRRRWCRRGALPVVCLVRARGVKRVEQGVLVVSIDQLTQVLRTGASQPGIGWLGGRRRRCRFTPIGVTVASPLPLVESGTPVESSALAMQKPASVPPASASTRVLAVERLALRRAFAWFPR